DYQAQRRSVLHALAGVDPERGSPSVWSKALKKYTSALNLSRNNRLYGPISGPAGAIGDTIGNAWHAILGGYPGTAAGAVIRLAGLTRQYRRQGRDATQAAMT